MARYKTETVFHRGDHESINELNRDVVLRFHIHDNIGILRVALSINGANRQPSFAVRIAPRRQGESVVVENCDDELRIAFVN